MKREQAKYGADRGAEEAQAELFPIIKPFARRQSDRILGPGERLVRAELWKGVAPMPGPQQVLPADVYDARQEAIKEYDAVTDLSYVGTNELAPLRAGMIDRDIYWTLLAQVTWK